MSLQERDRMKIVHEYVNQEPSRKHLTQAKAAQIVRLSERQFQRLVAQYRAHGDVGPIHRLRGQPSNRKLDPSVTAPQPAGCCCCLRRSNSV